MTLAEKVRLLEPLLNTLSDRLFLARGKMFLLKYVKVCALTIKNGSSYPFGLDMILIRSGVRFKELFVKLKVAIKLLTACAMFLAVFSATPSIGYTAGAMLTIGLPADPIKLDLQNARDNVSTQMNSFILEGLVDWTKDSKIAPSLAESWQFSQDRTVLTFKLRKGIKFQDGTDFNTYTVKANFDRILKTTPHLMAYDAFKDAIDKIVGLNDQTVQIRLKGSQFEGGNIPIFWSKWFVGAIHVGS